MGPILVGGLRHKNNEKNIYKHMFPHSHLFPSHNYVYTPVMKLLTVESVKNGHPRSETQTCWRRIIKCRILLKILGVCRIHWL